MKDITGGAREVAEFIRGTCMGLDEVIERVLGEDGAGSRDNPEFCAALDGMVFFCTKCDWWCCNDETSDEDGVCDECSGGEDDE